jgi:ADP-ribosylglycohydrolase
MVALEDRVTGVLLGLAAGDRIGGPVRMALIVAESLHKGDCFDPHDIAGRYLDWWCKSAFDTGPTTARVLALTANGAPIEEAAIQADREANGMTAGCNPAHRSAPLAMLASLEDSQLDEAAAYEARLTHRHPLAGEVAAVVARLCRLLIRGVRWQESLSLVAEGRSRETRLALTMRSSDGLSNIGFAPAVLRAAIHFINTSESFTDALERSIKFAGRPNYCPILVGSIGGARWGRTQIEDSLLVHHGGLVPQLKSVADNLAEGWRFNH